MAGAGFTGRWSELDIVYRSPPQLLRLLQLYRNQRLPEANEIVPLPPAQDELPLLDLCWRQVRPETLVAAMCREVDAVFAPGAPWAMSDLCIVVDSDELGLEVRDALTARNIRILTMIDENERAERRLKHAFFHGSARVKLTTIQSFEGWESPLMLVGVIGCSPEVMYTALSRLRRDDSGSRLTVVCANPEESAFGAEWPQYEDEARVPA